MRQLIQSKFIQLTFAIVVLGFVFPIKLTADNIPPENSKAQIPDAAAKGIEQANKNNDNAESGNHKVTPPKLNPAEIFYKGPLSVVDSSNADEPKKEPSSDENKGGQAVLKLSEVQEKLKNKLPDESKASEKILMAKEKIEEHVNSEKERTDQTSNPNDVPKVPDQGQVGLDKAKFAKENQGISQDHRKDLEHRPDVSVKSEDPTVKAAKKDEIEAKKKKINERLKALHERLKVKLAEKLPPKAKALQRIGVKPKD